MAVPFFIPEEDESVVSSTTGSEASAASSSHNSQQNSPTRPIFIPLRNNNSQSPQQSPIDNEMLVQAVYEALCRCSQGSPMSPPMSPSSPFNHGQFFFPRHMMHSASTSAYSSPRHSFRNPRTRLNSHGSYAQQESEAEDEEQVQQDVFDWENNYQRREQLEEFSGQVPQPKKKKARHTENNQKSNEKPKSRTAQNKNKITNFVISALQYVIDTLR